MVFTENPIVLLYPGAPQGPSASVVRIDFKDGCLIPLFIGTGPADNFLKAMGQKAAGMTKYQLPGLGALETLLFSLKEGGVTHVNFNAMPPGSPSPDPVPIQEVIDGIKNRLRL